MPERPLRRPSRAAACRSLFAAAAVAVPAVALPVAAGVAAEPEVLPVVTSVTPSSGPAEGFNEIIIRGTNLDKAAHFNVGRWPVKTVAVTPTAVVGTVSSYFDGATVDVQPVVTGRELPGLPGPQDDYTYGGETRHRLTVTPDHGPSRGGNTVTITAPAGADLSDAETVRFGPARARILEATATSVKVVAPGGPRGGGYVTVEGRDGHTDGFPHSAPTVYDWDAPAGPPVITSVSPDPVFSEAGGAFTIKGENLEGVDNLILDGNSVGGTFAFEFIETEPGGPLAISYPNEGASPGTHTFQVSGPAGTSAPAAFSTKPDAPAAVITSVSPATFSQTEPTELTIRGSRLANVTSAEWSLLTSGPYDAPVRVISDSEIRLTTPVFALPGRTRLRLKATGAPLSGTSDILQVAGPAPVRLSPASGSVYGGDRVSISAAPAVIAATSTVTIGGKPAEILWPRATTSMTVVTPAHPAGTGEVALLTAQGDTTGRLNPSTDQYRWVEAPALQRKSYDVEAVAAVPTIARGLFTLRGKLDADFDRPAGTVSGRLAFEPVSTRFMAGGFLPVVGRLTFVPSGAVTGEFNLFRLKLAAKLRVKLVDAKLFGAVPLALGNSCQSKRLSSLSADVPFTLEEGGSAQPVPLDVSDLNGCLSTEGIISSQTAGAGSVRLRLSR